MNRREFLKLSLGAGALVTLGPGPEFVTKVFGKTETANKVLILGLDGLDFHLLQVFMQAGKLPNFQRLRAEGDFRPLRTSIPPQSPVAWSNFITGLNPGGHAIFDFVHRDPKRYMPEFSATVTKESTKTVTLGNWVLPLSGGRIELGRKGKAFWQYLEDHDIPATVFKMPSNYPPAATRQRTLSGMGTPDILGTYGIFNYYTTESTRLNEDIGGGRVHQIFLDGNRVEAQLPGPTNTFKKDRSGSFIDFQIDIDAEHPVAKITLQGQEFILKEGEWSPWKRVRFGMIPTQSVRGICLFYLKQVRPEFKLYVSPVNIDPGKAALPISTPKSYCEELEKMFGPFHTKGLPADTSALDNGILDEKEFLEQDDRVLSERKAMFEYELNRFDSGLLFYYVSSTDQRQHMFWRLIDRDHPQYNPDLAERFGKVIEGIYIQADRILGRALKKIDKSTTLLVMSDHGFTSFRRSFNLNTWLKESGFHSLINPWKQGQDPLFLNTDWSRTKAYAMGLNGLYINQRNREAEGIVPAGAEKKNLIHDIARKLEAFIDPETGERPVLKAYIARDIYTGPHVEEAPDIIVGYNRNYRASWGTPLGRVPRKIIEDNTEKWSGDHCMDPSIIPGILFANRKVRAEAPALHDLTPTLLSLFGIAKPQDMVGDSIL